MRALLLLGLGLGLAGCGGGGARTGPAVDEPGAEEVADPFAGVGRPTLHLYAVLTADPTAMQGEPAVAEMWRTVAGQGDTAARIRRQVEWVPGDYRLNIDLDFADLPHPQVPARAFAALADQLPAPAAQQARAARLAVFFRSDAGLLPGDDHLRLVGLAALHAAERHRGVIYDLIARRAWTAEAFAAELAAPRLGAERHTRLQARADQGGTRWLLTRGEPRWGRPDLQIRRVPAAQVPQAEARLVAARVAAARLAEPLRPGQALALADGTVTLQPCEAPPGLHDAGCVQLPAP